MCSSNSAVSVGQNAEAKGALASANLVHQNSGKVTHGKKNRFFSVLVSWCESGKEPKRAGRELQLEAKTGKKSRGRRIGSQDGVYKISSFSLQQDIVGSTVHEQLHNLG